MPKVHRNCGKVESYNGEKRVDPLHLQIAGAGNALVNDHITAQEVEGKVFAAVEEHISVTSRDIKRLAKNALGVYHPDAAEIYALEEAF